MKFRSANWTPLVLLGLSLLAVTPAHAVDSLTRSAARDLGYEGVEAYQQQDYATALQKLTEAYEVLQAPSLALWKARAQEKNGQLVEAAETYLECIRANVEAGGDQKVQKSAQDSAAEEREALLPRIPKLTVLIEGVAREEVRVSIEDSEIAPVLLERPLPTNPGEVTVLGRTEDGREARRVITLEESAKESVTLDFSDLQAKGAVAATGGAVGEEKAPTQDQGAPGSWQRPVGWASFATGIALLGTGAATGILAQSKYKKLECDDEGVCSGDTTQDEVDSVNTLRVISPVTLAVGGVLAVTGVTLVLTAPKKRTSAYISPYFTFDSLGFEGAF